MIQKNKPRGMNYFAALALGVTSYIVGAHMAREEAKKDLASKVIGDHITIVDEALGTAELSDIDGDGDYDYLGIYPKLNLVKAREDRKYPLSYGAKSHAPIPSPSKIYIKPGFLAQSVSSGIELHLIEEKEFNDFVFGQNVPIPRNSLLNKRTTDENRSHVFGSYSGLFNKELKGGQSK